MRGKHEGRSNIRSLRMVGELLLGDAGHADGWDELNSWKIDGCLFCQTDLRSL